MHLKCQSLENDEVGHFTEEEEEEEEEAAAAAAEEEEGSLGH